MRFIRLSKLSRLHRRLRSKRGFTIVEIMIAVAISSLVMIAVMSTQYISARAIKDIYAQTRTRSSRMRGLDQIRYRLADAEIGTVSLTQASSYGYHKIEFQDPNLGGATSTFYFVGSTNTLFYDDDTADGDAAYDVVEGPIDISFDTSNGGTIILLKIKTEAAISLGDVDTQDGETSIYLRNI
jgi:prepilin-type N-terminal cleavage/methylation domain-containing protein